MSSFASLGNMEHLDNIFRSLSDSTYKMVCFRDEQTVVTRACSPYKSHTELEFSYGHGQPHLAIIQNKRFVLAISEDDEFDIMGGVNVGMLRMPTIYMERIFKVFQDLGIILPGWCLQYDEHRNGRMFFVCYASNFKGYDDEGQPLFGFGNSQVSFRGFKIRMTPPEEIEEIEEVEEGND